MPADDRQRLAEHQASLVRALMFGTEVPPDFDAVLLQACGQSLSHKRRRALAQAWPRLTNVLGERFIELFRAYAAQCPLPRAGGPLADGCAFAMWLKKQNALPDAGQWEALAVDLRFVRTSSGLRPRRGPCVRIARLRESRQWVIAWRLMEWQGYRTLWGRHLLW
jgi:hypothetical protein